MIILVELIDSINEKIEGINKETVLKFDPYVMWKEAKPTWNWSCQKK